MIDRTLARTLQLGLLATVFAAGFVAGSINRQPAEAQLGDLGKAAMEKAGESGGALGAATQLGSSISDMQQHIDGLQKNMETLKKVKASLGG